MNLISKSINYELYETEDKTILIFIDHKEKEVFAFTKNKNVSPKEYEEAKRDFLDAIAKSKSIGG